jgi:hypothetical protein
MMKKISAFLIVFLVGFQQVMAEEGMLIPSLI